MDLGLRIACLRHVAYEGPGAIADWARARRHHLTVCRLDKGDRLPVPEQFDWLILMGGPMGLRDQARFDWMSREKALVAEAIRNGKTVVGVCLGAQIIADVLGAAVDRNPTKEIGWFPVELTDDARRMPGLSRLPGRITPFHWHSDTFALPEGAVRLASSQACREQAFVYGSSVLAVQFHLEITDRIVEALLEHGSDDMAGGGPFVQDAGAIRRGLEEHAAEAHGILEAALDALPGAGTFITTDRLRLRRMRLSDAARIVRLDSDPEVKRWIDQGQPPDAEHIQSTVLPRWLALHDATGGLGYFAAEDRATGEFLGWFHLKPWAGDDGAEALELGYRLHRHRWGLGLATEGSRALIEAAFREFGAKRLVARAMSANSGSIRVLEKCGLMFSHEYEESGFPGPDRTAVVYDLEADDYEGPDPGY